MPPQPPIPLPKQYWPSNDVVESNMALNRFASPQRAAAV
jgi:hypothetical protein